MASGEIVAHPGWSIPPLTDKAEPATIADGSSPVGGRRVLLFDDTLTEYWYFQGVMGTNYAGTTGVDVELRWTSPDQISGNCTWGAAFQAIKSGGAVDAAFVYDFNTISVAPAGTARDLKIDNILFTDGADMNSVAAGDGFVLAIQRVGGPGLSGDAELHYPWIKIVER